MNTKPYFFFCQRFIVLVLAVAIIQSCGFKLRGELALSKDLSPMFIVQNTAFELSREIKSLLRNNAIELTDNTESWNSQLTLINEIKERRVLSVDSNGRAREYQLNYTAIFLFNKRDETAAQDTVTLSRSLLFDTDTVLAVENESEVLYREMQRDASRLILLKLQAYSLNSIH